mmetsp:Transcript_44475/g.73624  ORF Transcript_44475/g.73624 Transcript_44475/m.73624 type:complete len:270 (-) Transcript_44475:575-1384(-)
MPVFAFQSWLATTIAIFEILHNASHVWFMLLFRFHFVQIIAARILHNILQCLITASLILFPVLDRRLLLFSFLRIALHLLTHHLFVIFFQSLILFAILHDTNLLLLPQNTSFDLLHVIVRLDHLGVIIIWTLNESLAVGYFQFDAIDRLFNRLQCVLVKIYLTLYIIVFQLGNVFLLLCCGVLFLFLFLACDLLLFDYCRFRRHCQGFVPRQTIAFTLQILQFLLQQRFIANETQFLEQQGRNVLIVGWNDFDSVTHRFSHFVPINVFQ